MSVPISNFEDPTPQQIVPALGKFLSLGGGDDVQEIAKEIASGVSADITKEVKRQLQIDIISHMRSKKVKMNNIDTVRMEAAECTKSFINKHKSMASSRLSDLARNAVVKEKIRQVVDRFVEQYISTLQS